MPKVIKLEELADSYKTGVASKAQKWYNHFQAASGIAEAAKSEAAEAHYAAAVTAAVANKQRQKGLANITDADIKASVTSPSIYSTPAQNKAPKFAKKFARFVPVINAEVAKLPARTTDPNTNIDNRVKPIANALHAAKVNG